MKKNEIACPIMDHSARYAVRQRIPANILSPPQQTQARWATQQTPLVRDNESKSLFDGWARVNTGSSLLMRLLSFDSLSRQCRWRLRLIERTTWDRVQALLNVGQNLTHTTTYASDLIKCGHCGHNVTGELKTKKTKNGPKEYVYIDVVDTTRQVTRELASMKRNLSDRF